MLRSSWMLCGEKLSLIHIWQEDFFRLMDSACAACSKEQTHSLILRSKNGIVRVELEKLVYCEVMGRTLTFHLNSGVVLESMDVYKRQVLLSNALENALRACRRMKAENGPAYIEVTAREKNCLLYTSTQELQPCPPAASLRPEKDTRPGARPRGGVPEGVLTTGLQNYVNPYKSLTGRL